MKKTSGFARTVIRDGFVGKWIQKRGNKDNSGGANSSTQGEDSELERSFDYYWRIFAPEQQEPVKQMRFDRWMVDRAWPGFNVAVELNGGSGGGYGRRVVCHNCGAVVRARKGDGKPGREIRLPYPSHSGQGAERDAAKLNALQQGGWVVLVFTSAQLSKDPAACIQQVLVELRKAKFKEKYTTQGKEADSSLSKREVEILRGICEGKSYKEVAHSLGIAEPTVIKHTQNIRYKMNCDTVLQSCIKAVVSGLIDFRAI